MEVSFWKNRSCELLTCSRKCGRDFKPGKGNFLLKLWGLQNFPGFSVGSRLLSFSSVRCQLPNGLQCQSVSQCRFQSEPDLPKMNPMGKISCWSQKVNVCFQAWKGLWFTRWDQVLSMTNLSVLTLAVLSELQREYVVSNAQKVFC